MGEVCYRNKMKPLFVSAQRNVRKSRMYPNLFTTISMIVKARSVDVDENCICN